MGDTDDQNQGIIDRTNLSGEAIHVPHRAADSNRETSSPRPTPYEAHTVAPQTKLECPRIPRKGDTSSQIAPPSFMMVAGGKQCAPRSTITPIKTCSAIVNRHIKRRLGHSLKRSYCKGNLVPSRKQATHKLLVTKYGLFGPKRVP